MFHQIRSWGPTVVLLICLLTASDAASAGEFKLTILHNNDGESQLINAGEGLEDFGGVDRFKTVADRLKAEARMDGGVLMVSSGDNFLAGPEFNVSLRLPESAPSTTPWRWT